MRRFATVVLGVLFLPTLLATCGDDDEGLSKAEYTTQANAVCTRLTDQLNQTFEEQGFPVVQSQVPEFVGEVAPIITRGMNDLQALEAPEEDEAQVERLTNEAEELGARFDEARTDESEAQKLFQEEGGFEDFQERAKAYGLTACANVGGEDEEGEERAEKLDPATFSAEKRAYVEKVDAVCEATDEKTEPLEEEIFGEQFPPPLEKWAEFIPKLVAIIGPALDEIETITPPAADKAKIDAITAKERELLRDFEEAGRLAAAGEEEQLAAVLQEVFPQFDEIDADLRAYGFQVCGSEDDDDGEDEE